MSTLSRITPLCLAVIAIAGCKNGASSSKLVGSWKLNTTGRPRTWVFEKGGAFQIDSTIEGTDVKRFGTFTLDGNKLTLDLSGKIMASSRDPKNRMVVSAINASAPLPSLRTWDLEWKSSTEFKLTEKGMGEKEAMTFDRNR